MPDIEDKSEVQHIGSDHQLSPPRPWYRQRWILWTSLLLLLLLVAIVFLVVHENQGKACAHRGKAIRHRYGDSCQEG